MMLNNKWWFYFIVDGLMVISVKILNKWILQKGKNLRHPQIMKETNFFPLNSLHFYLILKANEHQKHPFPLSLHLRVGRVNIHMYIM